jgi:hypothetical protein
MDQLENQQAALKAEADVLLNEHDLLKILQKYGQPFITGSYALELMARRDLDINLETNDISVEKFFQMGGEIAAALKPHRMDFINEFVERHPRLPRGLYFGVFTKILGKAKEWCIDIWAIDSEQSKRYKKAINDIRAGIDEKKRMLILAIKNEALEQPTYQHNFFSIDIYQAVITGTVKTPSDFFTWVRENRTIDQTI